MNSSGSRLTGRAYLLLGVLSLVGTYACADRVVAPPASTPALDLEASAVFVSTLWRPSDTGATYLGGITGTAALDASHTAPAVATANVRPLDAARAPQSLGIAPSASPLADRPASGALERLVTMRDVTLPAVNGKRMRLRVADDPRRDGRGPMAVAIYQDDRPVAVTEYSYAKGTRGWRLARSRSTILDGAGKATLVVDNDVDRVLAAAARGAAPDASGTASRDEDGNYPDDGLTDDGEGIRCASQMLDVAAKGALWTAAAAAVVAAASSCTLAPPACAVALVAAEAALVAADIALGVAIGELVRCQNPPPPPPPPPPPTSSGGDEDRGDGWDQWCEYLNTYVNGVLVEQVVLRCWWQRV